MEHFRYVALCQEFPFIPNMSPLEEDGDSISIKRVDGNLLSHTPWILKIENSTFVSEMSEAISFVLKGGSILSRAVRVRATIYSDRLGKGDQQQDGETVLESIYRHDLAEDIEYIVSLMYTNAHGMPRWKMVIYKPARDFSLTDAIAEAEAVARAFVKAEGDF